MALLGKSLRGQRFWRPLNSSITSYDEKPIAYACALYTAIGTVTKPVTCTIKLASRILGIGKTVERDLVYNPTLLGPVMARTTFSEDFRGVTETVVTLADYPAAKELILVAFDTHAYDAYYK